MVGVAAQQMDAIFKFSTHHPGRLVASFGAGQVTDRAGDDGHLVATFYETASQLMMTGAARFVQCCKCLVDEKNMHASVVRKDEKYHAIPFLIVSAEGLQQNISEAFACGVSDYITKPFNAEDIITKIDQILTKPSNADTPATEDATGTEQIDQTPFKSHARLKRTVQYFNKLSEAFIKSMEAEFKPDAEKVESIISDINSAGKQIEDMFMDNSLVFEEVNKNFCQKNNKRDSR